MIFRKQKEGDSFEPDTPEQEIYESSIIQSEPTYNSLQHQGYPQDLRKRAFYWALGNKKREDLLEEVDNWHIQQVEFKTAAITTRVNFISEELQNLKVEIEEEKEKLSEVVAMEEEKVKLKNSIKNNIVIIESELGDMIKGLGEAHSKLLENRLKEVKSEFNSLVEMYNEVFENKFGNEKNHKAAIEKHIKICDDLIGQSNSILSKTSNALTNIYQFGISNYSSNLLVIVGVISAVASGWFFSIFADQNILNNQNWLFFILTNMFNYLSLYIEEYGQFKAAGYMFMTFTAVTLLITFIVYFSESFLYKVINRKSGIDFALELSPRKKQILKLNISGNSALSFWLKLLPWFFLSGIVIIMVAVGQTVGDETESIGKLGQHLSSQIIGTIITLLCSGLFFLYLTKVIEPRRESEKSKNKNKELIGVTVAVNVFLAIIISTQFIDGLFINKQALLSIIGFVLLVNLTSFAISYGVRHKGLIKTNEEAQQKIISLSNYRKVLSGNKPIHIWIKEDKLFTKKYLEIQNELFELIQEKNNLLRQTKRRRSRSNNAPKRKWYRIRMFVASRNDSSKKEMSTFYRYNFPGLSYQFDEKRNELNANKREMEEIEVKISELKEGRSDFQVNIFEEIRRLNELFTQLKNKQFELESEKAHQHHLLEEERIVRETQLIEGFQLGVWMEETLIKKLN